MTHLPQLIVLGGTRGSGKNTCANLLSPYLYHQVSFAAALKDLLSWVYDLPREQLEGITPEDRAWREQKHLHLKADQHWEFWSGKVEQTINYVYGPFNSSLAKDERYHPRQQINGYSIDEAVKLLSAGISAIDKDLSPVEAMQYFGTEVFRSISIDTWVQRLYWNIKPALEQGERFVVTDGRFGNEAGWGKRMNGKVIYIERPRPGVDPFGGHSSEHLYEFAALADVRLVNDSDIEGLEKKLWAAL